jgi:DNA polymerase-3 subunit beta
MKMFCTQENLNKGLNIVAHIASKNVNLPILNNVLLKTSGKILKLYASNLEIGITSLVRGKIEQEGEFVAEAKVLADYVGLLPNDNIELLVDKNGLRIICGNHNTQINGSSASEFPAIPTIEKKNGYKIAANTLKEALQQVVFAASMSDIRPEISGVLFAITGPKLTLTTTDSYRLAEKSIDITANEEGCKTEGVIVPLRTAQEMLRILSMGEDVLTLDDEQGGGGVNLYIEDSQILLESNNTELISKLVEGQYPDYKQIIPQDFKTNIIISRDELQRAVKAASLFTRSGVYDILLKINVDKNELEIFSENAQVGKNSIKISVKASGDDNEMVLNFKYLLDGLQSMSTDQVSIDIVDDATPCVVRPYKNEGIDKNHLYLIMPIRQ